MRSKGLIGVFGLLVILLLVLGVAYAHWSDSISINGTVETGTMSMGFTGEYTCVEEEPKDKEVAGFTVEFTGSYTDPKTGKSGYTKMTITITNAYPCYKLTCTCKVSNTGTIPIDVLDPVITAPDEVDVSVWYEDLEGNVLSTPFQADTCSSWILKVVVHVTQYAGENASYTFEVTLPYEQWG